MTVHTPQVTAVIVTYQSRQTVGAALDALQEAYVANFANAVVVDNASTDGTADFVAEHYPWVTLVRSDENLGYGRGCNRGFHHVGTPYVLILNPDALLDYRALQVLFAFLEANPRVGIAAPAIREGQPEVCQAAGLMTTPWTLLSGTLGSTQPYPERRPIEPGGPSFETNWVCGAAMLIRSDLFRSLDGFDPRFFLYFEETDLCRRVAARGCEIWTVGAAVAQHVGGASAKTTGHKTRSNCIAEHYYRSRFYYLVKHFGWFRAVGTETVIAAVHTLRSLHDRLTGRDQCRVDAPRRPFLQFPAQPRDAS